MEKGKSILGKIITILLIATMSICILFVSSCGDKGREDSSDSTVAEDSGKDSYRLDFIMKNDGACELVGISGTFTGSEIVIPSTYYGYPVTSIGEYAFYNCHNLTSITIPDSITSIGNSAFYGCDNLQYNEYDNGYYLGNNENPYHVFVKAKNKTVTSFTVNENTVVICYGAFYYCRNLTNIILPNSVISVGNHAFYGCRSLKYNEYDNGLYIGKNENPYYLLVATKNKNITSCNINENTKFIGDYAFYECHDLTSIIIPNGVMAIGDNAFDNCWSLESVTIGESVTSIGKNGFIGCGIISITIPDSLINIDAFAFAYCSSLQNVDLGQSVKTLGNNAFYACVSLTNIRIPNSVTIIDYDAFEDCYKLVEVYNLSSLNIEKGSKDNGYLGYYAINIYTSPDEESKIFTTNDGYIFYEDGETCYLLGYIGADKELILPKDCNGKTYEIYQDAFYNNENITSITIPNGVTSIGEYAFYGCKNLISVTIGNSVESIGEYAFCGCIKLKTVTNRSSLNIVKDSTYNGYVAYYADTIINERDD